MLVGGAPAVSLGSVQFVARGAGFQGKPGRRRRPCNPCRRRPCNPCRQRRSRKRCRQRRLPGRHRRHVSQHQQRLWRHQFFRQRAGQHGRGGAVGARGARVPSGAVPAVQAGALFPHARAGGARHGFVGARRPHRHRPVLGRASGAYGRGQRRLGRRVRRARASRRIDVGRACAGVAPRPAFLAPRAARAPVCSFAARSGQLQTAPHCALPHRHVPRAPGAECGALGSARLRRSCAQRVLGVQLSFVGGRPQTCASGVGQHARGVWGGGRRPAQLGPLVPSGGFGPRPSGQHRSVGPQGVGGVDGACAVGVPAFLPGHLQPVVL
ncbi:hypothetical protein CLUG_05251 [Clavispora lusitaniae ATCC 42720]|uniref:Uncharacterized protein n=1 Tax=Clavispora lusitaniae (strain ATCC 42720) TaxID=306902 RepID=C4YAM3_CLAL4|nr:uncharacterized protein CLUG_05251 [Clavispora lusitaniae ATCC 42720]EEQ41123.1 hypothetical protein CLUG_05251 [Clavispora lusitaniae ATCC 42720]